MKKNSVVHNIVQGWNVEAKLEDSKYFFMYKEVQAILNNRKCYVIGRKGAGKSAICNYITSIKEYNVFSSKLSFKAFPFNAIYGLEDNSFKQPNQYITIWKYIIYSNVLKLMVQNQSVEQNVRTELEKIYPKVTIKNLASEVTEWTSVEFGIDILGNGGSLKVDRNKSKGATNWKEYVDVMEDIIINYCGRAKYYIVFDELDDDYKDVTLNQEFKAYKELLTSLFKAVQDVKSVLSKERGFNIMPVIFLRNDIYAHIKDADKNKWDDLSIELEWDTDKLKQLLAYRIFQDDPIRNGAPDFEKEWHRIFSNEPIHAGLGRRKLMHTFDYMANSTLLRPRDFIKFIKACCEEVVDAQEYVTPDILHHVDRAFSNYIKQEFRDELYPILPDIDRIFDVLSYQRQWIFSPDSFKDAYLKEKQLGNIIEPNVDKVLETLYNFSVIGVVNKNNESKHYFKYINTNMAYNRYEKIVIHRGLFKALGVE